MATNIWDDAAGVTFNDVQAGRLKKPGAPVAPTAGKVTTTVAVPPPVTPLQQQLNTAMAQPGTPKAIASTTINEGSGITAAPRSPAPVPAMPVPPGIAANTSANPNPAAAYGTIADVPRPANQVQVPVGGSKPAPVVEEKPTPAALDPFAYRGGYPADAPKGPSNGPDSRALDPVPPDAAQADPKNFGPQNTFGQGSDPTKNIPGMTFMTGAEPGKAPEPFVKPGFDKNGVVTADSAAAAMGNPMARSGGIAGSYDGKGVNDILARENKARGEMIDAQIKAQGGNGIAVLPDRTGDANEQLQAMKLSPAEYLAYTQGKARQEAAVNESDARNTIAMRGQDLHAQTESARLAGNPIDNQIKQNQITAGTMANATTKQLADLHAAYGAEKDPVKRKALAESIRVMSGKDAASKYLVVPGGEYTDPENPLVKMKAPSKVLDTSTGQFTDAPMGGNANQPPAVDKKTGKPAAPKVGDVVQGHKYLGGNPADPKSWEKA